MAVHKKYNRNAKTNALGRGLDALISTETVSTQGSSTINEVPIEQIEANPNQPRREFDQIALEELANSIKQLGLVQPITLRQLDESKFQIIAGERRWRASQLAGLTAIPAYIRTIKDENVMELALVENIQREDLNAIEIALAYEHLQEKSGMTQERVAERVGKSRAAVANYLRLLKLPAQVQMALQKKEIDMGHARALLSLNSPSQQIKLFHEIQKNAFSVRKVEELCQQLNNGEDIQTAKKKIAAKSKLPEEFNILKKRLSNFFNTKVVYDDSIKILYPKTDSVITILNAENGKVETDFSLSSEKVLKLNKAAAKDSTRLMKDWGKWRPKPKKALWLAIALPGAGQIYNRKYWKLPIFYGGIAGCVYAMTWNNQMYRDYQRAYIDITDDDPNTQSYNKFLHLGSKVTEENKSFYQNLFKKRKDRYRRWRDLSIFATVAVYALSVIDAYVDASLSDFDISDDLSLRIAPVVMNGNSPITKTNLFKSSAIGIGCSLTF